MSFPAVTPWAADHQIPIVNAMIPNPQTRAIRLLFNWPFASMVIT
jgi:hypothetical protein